MEYPKPTPKNIQGKKLKASSPTITGLERVINEYHFSKHYKIVGLNVVNDVINKTFESCIFFKNNRFYYYR